MATISSTLTLIDNMSGELETIKKAVEDVANAFEGVSTSAQNAEEQVNGFDWAGFGKKCDDFGDKATKAGAKLTLGVTTPLVALGKSAYTTATDYETAFTGIRKTTDATEEEFAALYQGILGLSENTPTGFVELAGIGEIAGQLGVAKDELLGFIEAFDALQVSTNIQGEEGATDMARFLNIMDGSTANIKRVGGAIVDLGNNYATTENDILSMSTRMAAAGNLVGFSVPDILALSTVMSSLGIEAEAGGSAAGKLMKQMQLAAEVGVGSWQTLISGAGSFFEGQTFENIHDLEMTMDAMKKADISAFAASMGMTTDELNSAVDTAKDLEYFADVSGKTAAQFEKDWADNPAQSMIDFFAGLAELDESGAQSAISKLNEMGLTEIRLSNMVAAMASQPGMLREALAMAYAAYAKDPIANAMTEEAAKFYGTQASQNAMIANKWENTKANFGENLVTALQPAVDKVNELLTAFNGLSEVDQDKIIALMGALVFTGPAVTAIGGVAKAVGNISTAIGKIKDLGGVKGLLDKLAGFLATPVGSAMAVATAVGLIAAAINSIPTEAEKILSAVSNIQITVDEESVNETLAAIRKVREEAETLKNPEISQEYENTSAAVSMGFGTNTMYGNALGYESAKANADIDRIISDYSGQMREAEERIARAATDAERTEWFGKYQDLEAQMNADVASRRALYAQKVSELFNGMAAQYPEAAQAMEKVSKDYDLMGVILQANNFDWDAYADEAVAQADWNKIMKTMYSEAFDLGYMGDQDEGIFMKTLENGFVNNADWIQTLYDTVLGEMQSGVQTVSDNPVLAGFLQSIISDESVLQNLDFTQLQGALEGMVGALDFKQAVDKASESGNVNLFGQYLVEGLAEGVETNAGLIEPPFTTVKENALNALRAAFGIASPSTVMAAEGIFIPQGIAQGITKGTPSATAAIIATSNAVLAAARSVLTFNAGSAIGYNVTAGLAAGIRDNSGAAISAARSLANRVASTLRSALKVHSPSRVTYKIGDYTGMGFVNGLLANADSAESAMGKIVDAAESAWNTAAWSDIALFAGMEHDQLVSDAKDAVKISDADIRKIRDLAEREVINHFTTAKVEVQMTNNNNINSDMDIDGIINQLEVKVEERLEAVAEGVYA